MANKKHRKRQKKPLAERKNAQPTQPQVSGDTPCDPQPKTQALDQKQLLTAADHSRTSQRAIHTTSQNSAQKSTQHTQDEHKDHLVVAMDTLLAASDRALENIDVLLMQAQNLSTKVELMDNLVFYEGVPFFCDQVAAAIVEKNPHLVCDTTNAASERKDCGDGFHIEMQVAQVQEFSHVAQSSQMSQSGSDFAGTLEQSAPPKFTPTWLKEGIQSKFKAALPGVRDRLPLIAGVGTAVVLALFVAPTSFRRLCH